MSGSSSAPTVVSVHGPLRQLSEGRGEHELHGATVIALLRALEARYPALGGWIIDERGQIRRHINVFLDGERAGEETAVGPGARLEVLPAITGG